VVVSFVLLCVVVWLTAGLEEKPDTPRHDDAKGDKPVKVDIQGFYTIASGLSIPTFSKKL
jgi:hypothetical protein